MEYSETPCVTVADNTFCDGQASCQAYGLAKSMSGQDHPQGMQTAYVVGGGQPVHLQTQGLPQAQSPPSYPTAQNFA